MVATAPNARRMLAENRPKRTHLIRVSRELLATLSRQSDGQLREMGVDPESVARAVALEQDRLRSAPSEKDFSEST